MMADNSEAFAPRSLIEAVLKLRASLPSPTRFGNPPGVAAPLWSIKRACFFAFVQTRAASGFIGL